MRARFLACLALSCAFAGGCTYEPEGEFFKDIPQPDPQVTISLNTFDQSDTIRLYTPASFRFEVTTDKGIIKEVQVLVDNTLLFHAKSRVGVFEIDWDHFLKTGVHELKIQFITSTGSGSLADHLEAEHILVWRTWVLNIFVDPPPQPHVTLKSENGFLKVSWTPYTKPNFASYFITGLAGSNEPTVITNPYQNYIVDSFYAGGYTQNYRVLIETRTTSSSGYAVLNDDFSVKGQYRSSDSTMLLSWPKADFPGAFRSYSIIENGTETKNISNASDSSLRFRPSEIIFGLPVNFQVRLNAAGGTSPISFPLAQDNLTETPRLEPMQRYFRYNTTLNAIVGLSSSSTIITTYDPALTPQETHPIAYNSAFTPYMGAYIYYGDNDKGIVQLNLQTHEYNYIDILPMTTGGVYSAPVVASASVNQIVTFRYTAHNSSGTFLVNHHCVYDMANKVMLYKKEATQDIPLISIDGQYLRFGDNMIYRLNGTVMELLCQLPPEQGFLFFNPHNSGEAVTIYSNNVYVYDSETGVMKRKFNSPGGSYTYRGYDAATKNLLFAGSYEKVCYAINIDTQQQTEIKAYTTDAQYLQMINGYLFDQNGNYFKCFKN